jgi:hypothetical protein
MHGGQCMGITIQRLSRICVSQNVATRAACQNIYTLFNSRDYCPVADYDLVIGPSICREGL